LHPDLFIDVLAHTQSSNDADKSIFLTQQKNNYIFLNYFGFVATDDFGIAPVFRSL
jgi:hypothetical protein